MSRFFPILLVAVAGYMGYNYFMGDSSSRAAKVDLGQVQDRTMDAFQGFDGILKKSNATEVGDAEMERFAVYYASILNKPPAFYDSKFGVAIQQDASFLGFADLNANGLQEQGEDSLFKVEIDSENNRIIATDMSGEASHSRFSGTGFLTGMLMGHLLSRQFGAGVKPGSFNNRQTTARSQYKAPSARTSSSRPSSARSRARSGGVSFGK